VIEAAMGPLMIIDVTPAIEGTLGFSQIMQWPEGQHFIAEAAMETFVLATALGMVGRE
jgi:hypothetical protein